MYNLGDDTYSCDFCGFTEKWDGTDELHGDMWGCEVCGRIFCSKCLKERIGANQYFVIMKGSDLVKCPDCAEKEVCKDV